MASKLPKVNIVGGGHPSTTHVYDEFGNEIKYIESIKWESTPQYSIAHITLARRLGSIDVAVEAMEEDERTLLLDRIEALEQELENLKYG